MSVLQLVTNFTPKCLRCRKVSDSSAPFPASSDTAALPSLLQLPSSQLCWMLLRGDREAFSSLVQLGRASAGGYKALLTELLPCPAESHRNSPEEEGIKILSCLTSQQHVEVLGPQTPSPSTQQDREEAARQVGAQPHVLAVAGSWVEKVHRVSSRSLSCCLRNVCEAEGSPEVVLLCWAS